MDAGDLFLQSATRQGIERAERFVQQQHLRLHRQGARDGNALAHTAGKLRRQLVGRVVQPHERQRRLDTARTARPIQFWKCGLDRERDIAGCGHPGEQ